MKEKVPTVNVGTFLMRKFLAVLSAVEGTPAGNNKKGRHMRPFQFLMMIDYLKSEKWKAEGAKSTLFDASIISILSWKASSVFTTTFSFVTFL
jgi:hypothetical protein